MSAGITISSSIVIETDLLDLIGTQLQEGAGAAIARAAYRVETEAKLSIMEGEKTGHVYKRGTREHVASAPGEAPANDLGMLAGSIEADVSAAAADLEADVTADAGYAAYLEYGTAHIAPRPFMTPAAEIASAQLDAEVAAIRLG